MSEIESPRLEPSPGTATFSTIQRTATVSERWKWVDSGPLAKSYISVSCRTGIGQKLPFPGGMRTVKMQFRPFPDLWDYFWLRPGRGIHSRPVDGRWIHRVVIPCHTGAVIHQQGLFIKRFHWHAQLSVPAADHTLELRWFGEHDCLDTGDPA